MNYLKSISLMLLFSFLFACLQPPVLPPIDSRTTAVVPPRPDEVYDNKKNGDDDRDQSFVKSRDRRKGKICEDVLEKNRDHKCKEQCRDIYRRGDREDCEKLTVTQIDSLAELHEILEEADDDDLKTIDADDFDVYLNVSIEAFEGLAGKYSSKDAKEVLNWIAMEEKIAEVLSDEDSDQEVLKRLLESATDLSVASDDKDEFFTENIEKGDNLIAISLLNNNEEALNWFQEFIIEDSECEDEEAAIGCFTFFCKIGADLDHDRNDDYHRDDWLEYEDFKDYIEEIISEGTNGASDPDTNEWDTDDIEKLKHVDDWVIDLCGGLT